MKHKTLRCTAETAALLLTVAMLAFLIADCISTIRTGCFPPLIPAGIS